MAAFLCHTCKYCVKIFLFFKKKIQLFQMFLTPGYRMNNSAFSSGEKSRFDFRRTKKQQTDLLFQQSQPVCSRKFAPVTLRNKLRMLFKNDLPVIPRKVSATGSIFRIPASPAISSASDLPEESSAKSDPAQVPR